MKLHVPSENKKDAPRIMAVPVRLLSPWGSGQFFEHLGFTMAATWYIVGEYHGWEEGSTRGRLGDIRGRPNEDDLHKVKEDTIRLVGKCRM
jgi:hypothetical protein